MKLLQGLGSARWFVVVAAVLPVAAYSPAPTQAGGFTEVDQLFASGLGNDDLFGIALAVSGDTLVVGSAGDPSGFGAAWVFERQPDDSWIEVQKLSPTGTTSLDDFGVSVAIDGDVIAVGNPNSEGEVWVFERDIGGAWVQTDVLTAADGESVFLGFSVAVAGGVIAAGAPWTDFDGGAAGVTLGEVPPGAQGGAVYVFEQDGLGAWTEIAKLTDPEWDSDINLATEDRLGLSLAMTSDRIVAGGPHTQSSTLGPGSVLIFESDGVGGWTFEDRLPSPIVGEGFGVSVAISGETIVAGSLALIGDDEAFVYQLNAGSWVATELVPSGPSFDYGVAVAVHGDQIAVGARDGNLGIAYSFERDGGGSWNETGLYQASDGQEFADFGEALALGDEVLLIGAPGYDGPSFDDQGAVYVFGGGAPAITLSLAGSCPGTMTLTVETAEPNETVSLYLGRNPGTTVIAGGGCAGTELDLEPARRFRRITTDGNGLFELMSEVPERMCGAYMQGLDQMCSTSNLLPIPESP